VRIETDYRLEDLGLIPGSGRDFSLLYDVQAKSGAYSDSYQMDTWGSFPGG
jgi:hypothetical protein